MRLNPKLLEEMRQAHVQDRAAERVSPKTVAALGESFQVEVTMRHPESTVVIGDVVSVRQEAGDLVLLAHRGLHRWPWARIDSVRLSGLGTAGVVTP